VGLQCGGGAAVGNKRSGWRRGKRCSTRALQPFFLHRDSPQENISFNPPENTAGTQQASPKVEFKVCMWLRRFAQSVQYTQWYKPRFLLSFLSSSVWHIQDILKIFGSSFS
jgi:hypothetical protein